MSKLEYPVQIPVNFFREGDQFVAHCPVLDLSTSGRTFEQAQERFTEAVEMLFRDLIDRGTLDEVLESYGWHKVGTPDPRWVPPQLVRSVEQEALIPLGA